jgi:thiol-disulfide isomerase/thioredoxin
MFATWCSTCKLVLPKVLRVFDDAGNNKFQLRYIGIAMGGGEPQAELERYGHDYPAVILIQNGKELDRIVGEPTVPIEDRIVNILR